MSARVKDKQKTVSDSTPATPPQQLPPPEIDTDDQATLADLTQEEPPTKKAKKKPR